MARRGPLFANPLGIDYEWRRKYSCARSQAIFHKQEWAFTLETWYTQWKESGVMEHRGNKPHQYVMVRVDPIEAWGPHNTIIVSYRLLLKKHAYEKLLKRGPETEWDRKHDVSNKK